MTLIFDYDGTLHETLRIYGPALRAGYSQYLAETNQFLPLPSDDEIKRFLGATADEAWQELTPGLPEADRQRFSKTVSQAMDQALQDGIGRWYPGTEEVLAELKEKGHRLVLLSNCRSEYLRINRHIFAMDRYFSAYYAAEDYGWASKSDIFQTIRQEQPGDRIIIGDRYHEMEIARNEGLASIGCAYGYGTPEELSCATRIIQDIKQLPDALSEILRP